MRHTWILVALIVTLAATGCSREDTVATQVARTIVAMPTATSPPTATPVPPVHRLVACREMADHWTLKEEDIRKITKLSTRFKGQDRLECRGRVDVIWGPNYWAVLSAERDYRGEIYYRIREE